MLSLERILCDRSVRNMTLMNVRRACASVVSSAEESAAVKQRSRLQQAKSSKRATLTSTDSTHTHMAMMTADEGKSKESW